MDTSHEVNATEPREHSVRRSRFRFLVPVILFVGLATLLGIGLTRDPSIVPSPLIGRKIPEFELPPLPGRDNGLSSENLRGEVSLVNVFASWCAACRIEHPLLMRLRAEGVVPVHGINYKDAPDDAKAWLAELGDPYTRIGADRSGRVSIEWGVYGVPETFLVDRDGRIVYKQIGPLSPESLEKQILPLVSKRRQ